MRAQPFVAVKRFFRSPKGLLTIVLPILVVIAAPGQGTAQVAASLGAAVGAAALLDLIILRVREGTWEFPSGAVLTGLLIAMVLSAQQPWHMSAVTAVIAIASKYVFRTKSANVFNPAALAIVITFYLLGTGQSWWGALPDVAPALLVVLFATGIYITDRVNKMPLVLSFLGIYFLLFTLDAFAGDTKLVAEIFRTPDIQAVLFFAFFILTDPPTSPPKYREQWICGTLVAVASFVVFKWLGAVYYLLAGVLVGNVWEAWRRVRAHHARLHHKKAGHGVRPVVSQPSH